MFTKTSWTKGKKTNSNIELVYLVWTVDKKLFLSKRDATIKSYKLYTSTEIINDTIPFHHLEKLLERQK